MNKKRLKRLEQAATRLHPPRNPFADMTDEELDKVCEILRKHCAGIPLDAGEQRQLEIIEEMPHVPSDVDDMSDEELYAEIARLERITGRRIE